jgi:hypothetical protein
MQSPAKQTDSPPKRKPCVSTLQDEAKDSAGVLGKFFGIGFSASINIAGLVAVVSLVLIAASFFVDASPGIHDAREWLCALVASALSFVFGATCTKR